MEGDQQPKPYALKRPSNDPTGDRNSCVSVDSPLKEAIAVWEEELSLLIDHCHESPLDLPVGLASVEDLRLESEWILSGLRNGFNIRDSDKPDPEPFEVPNYPKAKLYAQHIDEDIAKEVRLGILKEVMEKPKYLTALNANPEKDKVRVIRDYSSPHGRSINDSTWNSEKFALMSLDDALIRMKPNIHMGKVDISSAYRAVPVRPDQHELLAFEWRGKYYLDTRLPFGLSNAPEIFVRITNVVRAMMARRGIRDTVVYVDDFLVFSESKHECEVAWSQLKTVLASLGFTVNHKPHKSVPPTKMLIFLGIELDSDCDKDGSGRMEARVSVERMLDIKALAHALRGAQITRKQELEHAVGVFGFAAKVVYGARPYLRRLIDLLTAVKKKGKSLHMTTGALLDLKFWTDFAEQFNGKAIILTKPIIPTTYFSVDASTKGTNGDGGIGGFFNGQYFGVALPKLMQQASPKHKSSQGRALFPDPMDDSDKKNSITYLELFVIWWACVLWDDRWQGYELTILTDNAAVFHFLRKGSARAPHFMRVIRALTQRMALNGFRLRPKWIPTKENVLSDPLSRGDWSEFHDQRRAWETEHGAKPLPVLAMTRAQHRLIVDGFPALEEAD